jgi:D-alanyl-D-alanine endopeptidase (penicillin-binding protein 7)
MPVKVFEQFPSSVYTMASIERIGFSMASRFAIAVLGLFLLSCSVDLHGSSIPSARAPKLRSAAFIVQDQRTGELLLAKQAGTAMPIASITKLMTAMVLLDAHLDMEEMIAIQEADKDTLRNSRSHLLVGTRLTRRDALCVALMASENRAAHALARTYPGGVRAFVKAMNEKARTMGLGETKFEDPTGLSEGNVSTAQDLSRLVAACSVPSGRQRFSSGEGSSNSSTQMR